jgi:hypothetical protein
LLRVGNRFKCTRDDLYEQCSLHITLKIPSSVSDGSRPSEALIRSYSAGVMPWSLMTSGVITGACVVGMGYFYFLTLSEVPSEARDPYFSQQLQVQFLTPFGGFGDLGNSPPTPSWFIP